nr:amidohydrolase family protein [Allomuricauda sp.]
MKQIGILIIVVLVFSCRPERSIEYDLVISNVNIIDGTGNPLQEAISVGIKDGKIKALAKELKGGATTVLDGSGKYLIPGLFDCHIHTIDYQKDFPKFVHYGVTSVFITGGSLCTDAYYAEMRKHGEQDSIPSPRVFHTSQHFSMEGRHPSKTYPSNTWRDGESIFYLKDTLQIEGLVQRVAQYPNTGIKLTIEDGPAPPFVERMPMKFVEKTVKEGEKYGLEVFAHVSDNIELEMAIRAGVQNLVHFTGIDIDQKDSLQIELLAEFRKRDPSWITTMMIDKSFIYPLHPEWFTSETLLPEYKTQAKRVTQKSKWFATAYLNRYKESYGLNDDDLPALMTPQVRDIQYLYDRGFNMVLGTDIGGDFNFQGHSLHEEMQLLEMGGMSPLEILKMGTINAAKMLRVDDELGSIEVGKLADMILLDRNPLEAIEHTLTIHTVIKNGKIQQRR